MKFLREEASIRAEAGIVFIDEIDKITGSPVQVVALM